MKEEQEMRKRKKKEEEMKRTEEKKMEKKEHCSLCCLFFSFSEKYHSFQILTTWISSLRLSAFFSDLQLNSEAGHS
jgi:hypothetical protein